MLRSTRKPAWGLWTWDTGPASEPVTALQAAEDGRPRYHHRQRERPGDVGRGKVRHSSKLLPPESPRERTVAAGWRGRRGSWEGKLCTHRSGLRSPGVGHSSGLGPSALSSPRLQGLHRSLKDYSRETQERSRPGGRRGGGCSSAYPADPDRSSSGHSHGLSSPPRWRGSSRALRPPVQYRQAQALGLRSENRD